MRDRLIELLEKADETVMGFSIDGDVSVLADHLLSEGVIVPPCKVGQAVWFIRTHVGKIIETKVDKVVLKNGGLYLQLSCNSLYETSCRSIGKTVFLTREEAEKALDENRQKSSSR